MRIDSHPIAFLPSAGTLPNRGLVRIAPDRVLAWNEHQKREAVTYHDVPPDRVIVTGAPRFDDFFAMRPSSTRDAFAARAAGLDASQPFLLYLCSSHFVAPDEVTFVRRWAAVRAHPATGHCASRPPSVTRAWDCVDLGDSRAASGKSRRGSRPRLALRSPRHCAPAPPETPAMNRAAFSQGGPPSRPPSLPRSEQPSTSNLLRGRDGEVASISNYHGVPPCASLQILPAAKRAAGVSRVFLRPRVWIDVRQSCSRNERWRDQNNRTGPLGTQRDVRCLPPSGDAT